MTMQLSERPTPQQWQVAAWMFIVALATLGSIGLWFGFRAPVDKADIARQLIWIGVSAWVAAVMVWGFKRGIEFFLE
jgi:hypothetical protein